MSRVTKDGAKSHQTAAPFPCPFSGEAFEHMSAFLHVQAPPLRHGYECRTYMANIQRNQS